MGSGHLTALGLGILYPLDRPLVIGSAQSCNILVKGAAPRHCQICRSAEGVLLKDLTGQNLVWVNGKPASKQILRDGDLVKVSGEEFRFSEVTEEVPVGLAVVEEEAAGASVPAGLRSTRASGASSRRIPKLSPAPLHPAARPAEASSRKPSWLLWGLASGAALLMVGLVLLIAIGRGEASAKRHGATPASAGSPRRDPQAAAPSRGSPLGDLAGLGQLCHRLNLLAIANHVAVWSGDLEKTAEIQERLAIGRAELARSTLRWSREQILRDLPAHFEEGEVLVEFDRLNLRRLERPAAIKRLRDFLGALRPGAALPVACERGGKRREFLLAFEGLPPGASEIARLAAVAADFPSPEPPPESAPAPAPALSLADLGIASSPPATPAPPAALAPAAPRFTLRECGALLRDLSRLAPGEQSELGQSLRSWGAESPPARIAAAFLPALRSAGPPGAELSRIWSAYLEAHPLEAFRGLSPKDHAAIAEGLLERAPKSSLLRLISLAHLLEAAQTDASYARLAAARGFVESQDKKLWGEPDQVFHHRLCLYYRQPAKDDAPLESSALSSPTFGTRYVGLLLEIQKTLARGWGFQSAYQEITQFEPQGGPRGARDHVRALLASYKDAVYCKQCKDGFVPCSQCQGKAKLDIPCSDCNGTGRTMAPGAANGALVTQRCRKCEGQKVFRGVGCPGCSKTGVAPCGTCLGRPWRDVNCLNRGCQGGMVKCSACQGKGRTDLVCPVCNGSGRTMAPGAANGAIVTQKCRNCEENHGVFRQGQECKNCKAKGWVKCDACQGATTRATITIPLDSVYRLESCRACAGAGWPDPLVALPCASCAGLGVQVKPQADPAKTLE